jgi:hypothetical protein
MFLTMMIFKDPSEGDFFSMGQKGETSPLWSDCMIDRSLFGFPCILYSYLTILMENIIILYALE